MKWFSVLMLVFSCHVIATEVNQKDIPGPATYKFPSVAQIIKYMEVRKSVLCATRVVGSHRVLVNPEACRKEIDLQLRKLLAVKGISAFDNYRSSLVEFQKQYF